TWAVGSGFPLVKANNFAGSITLLNNFLDGNQAASQHVVISGNGSAANVLSAHNTISINDTAANITAVDQTNPPGQISDIGSSPLYGQIRLPWITNKVLNASPSQAWLENMLALHRSMDTSQSYAVPSGVTDVKLFRVSVSAHLAAG